MVAGGPGRTLGTGTDAPARHPPAGAPSWNRAVYAPGALEEMLAGKMEGETLDDTWGILFAALVVIPLVVAGLTLLVSDRVNRYLNLVAGPAFGLLSALPVTEILEGTFDGHVVMALTAAGLGLLIGGLSGVELRQPTVRVAAPLTSTV